MRATFLILFFFTTVLFSQTETKTPTWKEDNVLLYDTMFQKEILTKNTARQGFFLDEENIERRLSQLNKLTPMNLVYNTSVLKNIKFYLLQRKEQVGKLLALSEYYYPIFEEYLDKNNLPLELKHLPVIESSLNPNARSYAGAVGLWQFMYPTAKEYGLRINSYLDERKDIYKSTQAACDYLIKAHKVFNDWDLALSSYNAGRGNITKAIRRSGGKLNYWELRPFLPKQTSNYIPAFIAAVYVMTYAEEHGIYPDTNYLFKSHQIDSVYLQRPMKIAHLSKLLSIDSILLAELNPVYRNKLVPSLDTERFSIALPENKVGLFIMNEENIYKQAEEMEREEQTKYPEFTDIEKIRYRVKSGDYLGKIANKYKCTIKDIMLWNDLKSHNIKVGQRLNIYKNVN